MKPLLFGNHDNHSITRCFLPIIEEMQPKTSLRDYNFQLRDVKLCEVIPEIKLLWGWVGKILERDKLKNRAETGKCPIFQGFEVKFLQFVLEW